MVFFALEGLLITLIAIGVLTIVWGVRRFNLPTVITTIAFAITALSWVAFLVTTIGLTVRTFVSPNA